MLRREAISALFAGCAGSGAAMRNAAGAEAADFKVRLSIAQGAATVEVPLERYVGGVLVREAGTFRSDEALKAMAVAARSYAMRLRGRHSAEGFDFCTTSHCQRFDPGPLAPRLDAAVAATAGELLWWGGKAAFACYTSDCGGKAEDASAVWANLEAPYLRGHEDPNCSRTGASSWRWSANPHELADALHTAGLKAPTAVERIVVLDRTDSGRAHTLALLVRQTAPPRGAGVAPASPTASLHIAAGAFRIAVGRTLGWTTVLSDLYQVISANGRVIFEGSGAGHGVGLCQRGADQMGIEGRSYHEILAFYYPGATAGMSGTASKTR